MHSLSCVKNFLHSTNRTFTGVTRGIAAVAVITLATSACGGAPEPPAQQPAAEAPAPAAAPTPAAAPAGPAFVSSTPADLMKIYQDNDAYQANEMASAYIDRMMKVDAVVKSVTNGADGVVVVTSTGADPKDPATLSLLFPKAAESAVASLKPGANIMAGCHIRKIDKTKIELADCALL